jgi:hypothetical protein
MITTVRATIPTIIMTIPTGMAGLVKVLTVGTGIVIGNDARATADAFGLIEAIT